MPAASPSLRAPSVLTVYSAADLLTAPGCPVCRYVGEVSGRYLDWFALEAHAEAGTITRLCASLGMCARHTRRLMGQPGAAIRLTAVYRYIVAAARDQLAGRAVPLAGCPSCAHDEAATDRALETLLDDLTDARVRDRCRELGGLCVPHLRTAAACGPRRAVRWLAETMSATASDSTRDRRWLFGAMDRDAQARAALRETIPAGALPGSPVCPVCLAASRGERDLLARLADRSGQDGQDGQGPDVLLCAGHLADAAVAADRGGCLESLLAWQAGGHAVSLSRPPAHWARRSGNPVTWRRAGRRHSGGLGGCPVCHARSQAAVLALGEVRDGIRAKPRDLHGTLCVRHLLRLRAADPWAGQLAAKAGVEHADLLIVQLTQAFRKNTWTYRAEARGPEMAAWRLAAAFLDGNVCCGCPPPEG